MRRDLTLGVSPPGFSAQDVLGGETPRGWLTDGGDEALVVRAAERSAAALAR